MDFAVFHVSPLKKDWTMAVYYLLLAVRLLPAALSGAVSASAAAIELSVKTKPKAEKKIRVKQILCAHSRFMQTSSLY